MGIEGPQRSMVGGPRCIHLYRRRIPGLLLGLSCFPRVIIRRVRFVLGPRVGEVPWGIERPSGPRSHP